jgi:hypothetical protein
MAGSFGAWLGNAGSFGDFVGTSRFTPPTNGQLTSLLGPPRPADLTQDRIYSEIFAPPYRGPGELDNYGRETPEMRTRYRTQYLAEPVVKAAVQGKVAAVSILEVSVLPADRRNPIDRGIAEFVHWTVARARDGWHGLIRSILLAGVIDGWSLCEKKLHEVRYKGRSLWGLDHVRNIDSGFMRLELDIYRNVTSIVSMVAGLTYYSPNQVLLYTHNPLYSNPFGHSDIRAATRAANIIEDVYKLWYVMLRVYGTPYMHGKVKDGTQRKMMEATLAAIRGGGWGVTGVEDEIEVLNLAVSAAAGAFKDAVQTMREDILFAIRGAALPFLEGDGGNSAHGDTNTQKVATDVTEEMLALDAMEVINHQLIPHLVYPNWGAHVDLPTAVIGMTNVGEMLQVAQMVKAYQDTGLALSKEWVYQLAKAPPPDDPEDELKPSQPPPGPGGMPGGGPPGLNGKPPGLNGKPPEAPSTQPTGGPPHPGTPPKTTEPPATFSDRPVYVPLSGVRSDPDRFQYRRGADDDDGTVRPLPAAQFDPALCPPLAVWDDPVDGNPYVVDGHHRLAWAERDGATSVPVKWIEAGSAAEAKKVGERLNRPAATFSDGPPRPGLVPKSGDPAHPVRWLRPETATDHDHDPERSSAPHDAADPGGTHTLADLAREFPEAAEDAKTWSAVHSAVGRVRAAVYGWAVRQTPAVWEALHAALDTPADFARFGYAPGGKGDPLATSTGIGPHIAAKIASTVLSKVWVYAKKQVGKSFADAPTVDAAASLADLFGLVNTALGGQVLITDTVEIEERLTAPEAEFAADSSGHEHKGKGSPDGGQFVKGGGGGDKSGVSSPKESKKTEPLTNKKEGKEKPVELAPADKMSVQARAIVGTIKPSKKRAFTGQAAGEKIDSRLAGAIGEEILIQHLKSLGYADAAQTSDFLHTTANNLPIDLIHDHRLIEAKAGQTSNPDGVWALKYDGKFTKDQEAKFAKMPPEKVKKAKARINKAKVAGIHARKAAFVERMNKELGFVEKAGMMCVLVNPDTRTADLYEFDGFHDRIPFKSEQAQKAYVGSVRYG